MKIEYGYSYTQEPTIDYLFDYTGSNFHELIEYLFEYFNNASLNSEFYPDIKFLDEERKPFLRLLDGIEISVNKGNDVLRSHILFDYVVSSFAYNVLQSINAINKAPHNTEKNKISYGDKHHNILKNKLKSVIYSKRITEKTNLKHIKKEVNTNWFADLLVGFPIADINNPETNITTEKESPIFKEVPLSQATLFFKNIESVIVKQVDCAYTDVIIFRAITADKAYSNILKNNIKQVFPFIKDTVITEQKMVYWQSKNIEPSSIIFFEKILDIYKCKPIMAKKEEYSFWKTKLYLASHASKELEKSSLPEVLSKICEGVPYADPHTVFILQNNLYSLKQNFARKLDTNISTLRSDKNSAHAPLKNTMILSGVGDGASDAKNFEWNNIILPYKDIKQAEFNMNFVSAYKDQYDTNHVMLDRAFEILRDVIALKFTSLAYKDRTKIDKQRQVYGGATFKPLNIYNSIFHGLTYKSLGQYTFALSGDVRKTANRYKPIYSVEKNEKISFRVKRTSNFFERINNITNEKTEHFSEVPVRQVFSRTDKKQGIKDHDLSVLNILRESFAQSKSSYRKSLYSFNKDFLDIQTLKLKSSEKDFRNAEILKQKITRKDDHHIHKNRWYEVFIDIRFFIEKSDFKSFDKVKKIFAKPGLFFGDVPDREFFTQDFILIHKQKKDFMGGSISPFTIPIRQVSIPENIKYGTIDLKIIQAKNDLLIFDIQEKYTEQHKNISSIYKSKYKSNVLSKIRMGIREIYPLDIFDDIIDGDITKRSIDIYPDGHMSSTKKRPVQETPVPFFNVFVKNRNIDIYNDIYFALPLIRRIWKATDIRFGNPKPRDFFMQESFFVRRRQDYFADKYLEPKQFIRKKYNMNIFDDIYFGENKKRQIRMDEATKHIEVIERDIRIFLESVFADRTPKQGKIEDIIIFLDNTIRPITIYKAILEFERNKKDSTIDTSIYFLSTLLKNREFVLDFLGLSVETGKRNGIKYQESIFGNRDKKNAIVHQQGHNSNKSTKDTAANTKNIFSDKNFKKTIIDNDYYSGEKTNKDIQNNNTVFTVSKDDKEAANHKTDFEVNLSPSRTARFKQIGASNKVEMRDILKEVNHLFMFITEKLGNLPQDIGKWTQMLNMPELHKDEKEMFARDLINEVYKLPYLDEVLNNRDIKDLVVYDYSEYTIDDDFVNHEADGVDELLLPIADYDYEAHKNDIFDFETEKPKNIVKQIDNNTFISTVPVSHPISQGELIGREYVEVDVNVLKFMLEIFYITWQNRIYKFGMMDLKSGINQMLKYMRIFIEYRIPPNIKAHADRAYQLIRWYAEYVIIHYSEYKIKKVYLPWKSNLHEGYIPCRHELNGFAVSATSGIIRNTKENAEMILYLKPQDGGYVSFSYTFTGSMVVYINTEETFSAQSKSGVFKRTIEKGDLEIKFVFDGSFCLIGNIIVDNCIFDTITTEYEFVPGKANYGIDLIMKKICAYYEVTEANFEQMEQALQGLIGLRELTNNLVEYYDSHHKDKAKGKRITIKNS